MLKIYLASPYSKLEHEEAYRKALFVTKNLLEKGIVVFSPIVYAHQMRDLGEEFGFWGDFNKSWIDWADILVVYTIPGWAGSIGINAEIRYAKSINKLVRFCEDANEIMEVPEWQDS